MRDSSPDPAATTVIPDDVPPLAAAMGLVGMEMLGHERTRSHPLAPRGPIRTPMDLARRIAWRPPGERQTDPALLLAAIEIVNRELGGEEARA